MRHRAGLVVVAVFVVASVLLAAAAEAAPQQRRSLFGGSGTLASPPVSDPMELLTLADTELLQTADDDGSNIAVYFAPYDPLSDLYAEVSLIRKVVAERLKDGGQYAPGTSPFSIRYAVYNIQEKATIAALIAAHNVSGVDVQMLMDGAQLQPNRTWNTGWRQLVAAGFGFSATQLGLTAQQQRQLNLIGIQFPGQPEALMHLKTRLFLWVDHRTRQAHRVLITGSLNPEDAALLNNETLVVVQDDAPLIARYQSKYDSVLRHQTLGNAYNSSYWLNALFSPGQPNDTVLASNTILELIDSEPEVIFLSVYAMREFSTNLTSTVDGPSALLYALEAAVQRGVHVYVVTDYDTTVNDTFQLAAKLRAAGIPVFECTNPAGPFNAMHHKNGVYGVRRVRVSTDTGNWSAASMGSYYARPQNDESYLFFNCSAVDQPTGRRRGGDEDADDDDDDDRFAVAPCDGIALRFLSNFMALVRFYQMTRNNTQEPTYAQLWQQWQQLDGWWQVGVDFAVVLPPAASLPPLSQPFNVSVIGNAAALGNWSDASLGLPLVQSPTNSSLWQSPAPVVLPLGMSLDYKYQLVDAATGDVLLAEVVVRAAVVDPALIQVGRVTTLRQATADNFVVPSDNPLD